MARVILGVTGSVAAIKAPELFGALYGAGHDIREGKPAITSGRGRQPKALPGLKCPRGAQGRALPPPVHSWYRCCDDPQATRSSSSPRGAGDAASVARRSRAGAQLHSEVFPEARLSQSEELSGGAEWVETGRR